MQPDTHHLQFQNIFIITCWGPFIRINELIDFSSFMLLCERENLIELLPMNFDIRPPQVYFRLWVNKISHIMLQNPTTAWKKLLLYFFMNIFNRNTTWEFFNIPIWWYERGESLMAIHAQVHNPHLNVSALLFMMISQLTTEVNIVLIMSLIKKSWKKIIDMIFIWKIPVLIPDSQGERMKNVRFFFIQFSQMN